MMHAFIESFKLINITSWELFIPLESAYLTTKAQISVSVTAKLISTFVFAAWIVQSYLILLKYKQASSLHLWLYRLICVGPGRKPRLLLFLVILVATRKVPVGKDQEKAQSEKDSHSKNRGGKKQTNNLKDREKAQS